VKSGSAHCLPFQRRVQRVVRKMCHLIIIALIKPDTLTTLKVNRRNNFYCKLL
jgi:hypothetical protein